MVSIPQKPRLFTLLIVLVMLLTATLSVQAQEAPLAAFTPTPVRAIKVADQRVGLATSAAGNAENFMASYTSAADHPLATLPPGMSLRLYTLYEAVFFPTAAGQARLGLAVYRRTPQGDILLKSEQTSEVGSGPRRKVGSLGAQVRLTEPGLYQLAIVARATADPAAGREVTDQDELVIWVLVQGSDAVTPEPPEVTREALPDDRRSATPRPTASSGLVQPDPGQPEAGQGSGQPTDESVVLPEADAEPVVPLPTDRTVQVAYPRGHFISSSVAAVENFDQGHGCALTVRQGDTIDFQSAYEFVWYGGATGGGQTSLTITLDAAKDGDPPLGSDTQDANGANGMRLAGVLQAPVLFAEAGKFVVVATIESRVTPGQGLDAVTVDVDRVRMEVKVIGQPETGAIAGTVTEDGDDAPLERIQMRVLEAESGRLAATVFTAADGTYLVTGLRPTKYLVFADPGEQNYMPEWYDDAASRQDATPVEVLANATLANIDFGLTSGGVISGQATEDPEGSVTPVIVPISGVVITVGPFGENRILYRGITGQDGRYRIARLPSGSYWVRASKDQAAIIPEYWDDQPTLADADEVIVVAGKETADIDFSLRYGGAITGKVRPLRAVETAAEAAAETAPRPTAVTAVDARPFNFRVSVYAWSSNELVTTVNAGLLGDYRITSLPEGRYRLYAFDPEGRYVPEYYDDVTVPEEATPVPVERGKVTSGIDFDLNWAGVTIVQILPSTQSVQVGDIVTIMVGVLNVVDLSSFSLDLRFQPGVLQAQSAQFEGFLGSTGRTTTPLGPTIDNAHGLLTFGAFSVGMQDGPSGSGLLATITLEAVGQGESSLTLGNVQLLDTDSQPIATNTRSASVRVGGCMLGDFDCDCDIDILDVMQVALRWGTVEGDPEYDATYDLDHDGDIDIVDVAIVAALWGTTCADTTANQEPAAAEAAGLSAAGLSVAGPSAAGPSAAGLLATGLRLQPAQDTALIGQPKTVQVWVDEVQDLASFEFALEYDATRLGVSASDVALGSFLSSTGRSASPMGPVIHVAGGVGTLSLGAMSLGFAPPGPSGSGVIAEITFTPLQPGSAALALTAGQLANTLGASQQGLALSSAALDIASPQYDHSAFVPLIRR
jgi:hypothetical protein